MNKYDYDVIIIGAGISGLVCGCYLAKAGLKTLIIEKNAQPGGYCTSFTRKGYHFDACVHGLGSLREGGIINKVLKELSIYDRINIIRSDPSNVIVTPDYKISFWDNLDKTIQDFQKIFPKEGEKIKKFFNDLVNLKVLSYIKLRNITFESLLKRYFKDIKLRAIFSFPILINTGLPSSMVSAFLAVINYKEWMFDSGYYPEEGIQELPNVLTERFIEFGGNILLSRFIRKIKIEEGKVKGVISDDGIFASARYVVSGVDARQTFLNFIDEGILNKFMEKKLKTMVPSLSMFVLYLGIDKNLDILEKMPSNIWYLPNYNISKMYISAKNWDVYKLGYFLVKISPQRKSIMAFVNAPFKDEKYWRNSKKSLIDNFIKKIESVIPDLSKYVVFKNASTPHTLFRYTLNYKGAAYGWAALPSQYRIQGFSQTTPIQNLYLTGHWGTLYSGVSGVSYLGCDTAKMILRREKRVM